MNILFEIKQSLPKNIKDSINFLIHQSNFRKQQVLLKLQKRVVDKPIFIVGCGHSGTSIILALLDAHSKLYAIPYESYLFCKFDSKVDDTEILFKLAEWQKETLKKEKKRFVEKTPAHIHRMGKILRICPDAKIICMLRDGRDVACSFKARGSFSEGIRRWTQAAKDFYILIKLKNQILQLKENSI